MKRKLLVAVLFFLGLVSVQTAHAQIVDDSTKAIFSPKTTLQLFENDVLEGRYIEERIDTTINNFNNERYWYHDTAYYQHLGNIGTTTQPLLFRTPTVIGARFGRNAFDRYAYDPYNLNYYDTRSPYSHLMYIQGGRGEQEFEAIYARNITPRWNIGMAYQLLAAQRQLSSSSVSTSRGDRVVNQQAFKAFSHYAAANKKYDLFVNYTFFKAEQIEQGGVFVASDTTSRESLFNYQSQQVNLEQAATTEKRSHFHLLHIYKLAQENLKLYHMLDGSVQQDEYEDDASQEGSSSVGFYYPIGIYNQVRTDDVAEYKELQNVFGLTGNNKVSSYKAYAKLRNAKVNYSTLETVAADTTQEQLLLADKAYNQFFVGGQLRLFYENKAELAVEGEFQLSNDYRVRGVARFAGLSASLQRVLQSPSVTEEYLLSNQFYWNNTNFNNSVTDRGEVSYEGKLGARQFVRLTGNYTNIKRYIFYNDVAEPQQLSGNQRLWGAELAHHIRFGPIHFENFVAYTNTDEADRVRVPEWLLDSKLYFQGSLFKKALDGQFGLQATMPTGYFADSYMPVTQQFYVQDNFKLDTYPVIDVFLTADIKNVNVFLKMSHVNYDLWTPGYFATPYYPGLRRSFVFGIKWMFFD